MAGISVGFRLKMEKVFGMRLKTATIHFYNDFSQPIPTPEFPVRRGGAELSGWQQK
jgi:hypothetical protein